jgi:hypothetical protein
MISVIFLSGASGVPPFELLGDIMLEANNFKTVRIDRGSSHADFGREINRAMYGLPDVILLDRAPEEEARVAADAALAAGTAVRIDLALAAPVG